MAGDGPMVQRKNIKVLVFTTLYPNNVWSNQGVFVKERITSVARMEGYDLKVVAPVPYYPPINLGSRAAFSQVARTEVIEGVQVYHPRYFMIPKVGMVLHGVMMFLSVLFFVKKIQEYFDFDIIDAHYVYPDGFAGILLGAMLRKPVVITARGSDINQFLDLIVVRRLVKFALHRADRLITVCAALKDAIVECGVDGNKVTVVPNGVDVEKFFPVPMNVARDELGLPRDRKIILSVGSLIPRKGLDLLIKAFGKLNESPQINAPFLVIVGSGPDRAELNRLVSSLGLEDQVYFAGEVAHDKLVVWYGAADLFCLTSSKEGWPNVILESLACGTPVVAADIWGVPEIFQSEDIGLLTKRDEIAIASGLLRGLEKNWRRETIVEFARQHTWSRVAESVQKVFESVIETLPPPALTVDAEGHQRNNSRV